MRRSYPRRHCVGVGQVRGVSKKIFERPQHQIAVNAALQRPRSQQMSIVRRHRSRHAEVVSECFARIQRRQAVLRADGKLRDLMLTLPVAFSC